MEQMVNGLIYDTEKAARVASNEYWDGHNWDRDGRNTYLYKTRTAGSSSSIPRGGKGSGTTSSR